MSVTGLEFAYTEAPESMKSAMSAVFLLTSAVADLTLSSLWPIFTHWVPDREMQSYWSAALLCIPTWIMYRLSETWQYAKPTDPFYAEDFREQCDG